MTRVILVLDICHGIIHLGFIALSERNGVLSLVAAGFAIAKAEAYPTIILLQGAILTGWTLIQVYLLPDTHPLQLVFAVLGIMLMLYGSFLRSRRLV